MPPLVKQFVVLFVLTGIGAGISLLSGLAPKPWQAQEVLPGQIEALDAKVLNVIWLDARSKSDYKQAHIPGALFYDQTAPEENLLNLFPLWIENPRPIVVYCADEGCGTSKKVAEFLRENLSEAEIYTLQGGWASWQE